MLYCVTMFVVDDIIHYHHYAYRALIGQYIFVFSFFICRSGIIVNVVAYVIFNSFSHSEMHQKYS
jgi:hypothetical protein